MTCLGCNNIEANPKTLVDGRIVCNSCADWRHECEARSIAALGTLAERRAWLDGIEARRGKPAREALQHTMKLLWDARAKA